MRIGAVPPRGIAGATLLRLLVASALLLPLASLYGDVWTAWWLPAYRQVFTWVAEDFKLLQLAIDVESGQQVLKVQVSWRSVAFIGDRMIFPDPRGTATSSTLLADALRGPLLAALAAAAWPTAFRFGALGQLTRWVECSARVLVLVPLIVVLTLIDLPLVLAGVLWRMVLDAMGPEVTSPLVIWATFLLGGGRSALGLLAGVLAALLARPLAGWMSGVRRRKRSAAPS